MCIPLLTSETVMTVFLYLWFQTVMAKMTFLEVSSAYTTRDDSSIGSEVNPYGTCSLHTRNEQRIHSRRAVYSHWTCRLTVPTPGEPRPLSATHSYTPAMSRAMWAICSSLPGRCRSPDGSVPCCRTQATGHTSAGRVGHTGGVSRWE